SSGIIKLQIQGDKMRFMTRLAQACAVLSFTVAAAASAKTTWDMPTPYPDSIFHTENIQEFSKRVEQLTEGELKIVVHSGASLFKANEIKRAVQGGQVQIGEILLASYSNENPIFGVDSIPFFA